MVYAPQCISSKKLFELLLFIKAISWFFSLMDHCPQNLDKRSSCEKRDIHLYLVKKNLHLLQVLWSELICIPVGQRHLVPLFSRPEFGRQMSLHRPLTFSHRFCSENVRRKKEKIRFVYILFSFLNHHVLQY